MAIYPDGAIQTKEELLSFTEGNNGVLYRVINGNAWGQADQSRMEDVKFSRGSYIYTNKFGFMYYRPQKSRTEMMPAFSFRDMNIGGFNTYNDHFVFMDKEKAQAYLAAAKNGWHKHSA